ncbi:hypothetical protein ABWK46_13145, partial [Peribacillus frigoritolerans]|uniref:hypothetical protein n=1 Tax=Peribacillus frigoritolerans TaxID=450367 RepID=UPI0033999995
EQDTSIKLMNRKNIRTKFKKDKKNNKNRVFVHRAFVTLVLQRLAEEPNEKHNNPPGRFDLLKNVIDEPRK